jgi:hypothetical protein
MSLCDNIGSTAAPLTGQQFRVHTQRFAFHAGEEDDESVKLSNIVRGRSGALSPALQAIRPGANCLQNRRFIFDTNERFSFTTNSLTHTKQSTSFFLFDTNERSRITDHQSLIINDVARTGKIRSATEGQS